MASSNFYAGYQYGAASYPGYVNPNMTTGVYSGQPLQTTYPTTSRNTTGYEQSYLANQLQASYAYTNRPQSTAYPTDGTQYPQVSAYPYTQNSTEYTNTYNSVVTNYAASTLYQQAALQQEADATATAIFSSKNTNWDFKKSLRGKKPSNKTPTTIHYCDICKISCAGPQTYKEHLDGQRHKKKEAQIKNNHAATIAAQNKRHSNNVLNIHCQLCDVICTGNEAYTAHVRGTKHQKVLKLHTKLGKPIPQMPDPSNSFEVTTTPAVTQCHSKIKILGTPKINFVQGGRLHTTSNSFVELETDLSLIKEAPIQSKTDSTETNIASSNLPISTGISSLNNSITCNDSLKQTPNENNKQNDQVNKEPQPVGQDYIEQLPTGDRKIISYHCKLCDCKFSDPTAKEMHLKGRRHRLQYKKKVDPTLIVDYKPSVKSRNKGEGNKAQKHLRQQRIDLFWNDNFVQNQQRYNYENRYSSPLPPLPPINFQQPVGPPNYSQQMSPLPNQIIGANANSVSSFYRRGSVLSWDDNHIMQKHSEIIIKEDELDDILHIVQMTERALKFVSDKLAEEDAQLHASELLQKELCLLNEKIDEINSEPVDKENTTEDNKLNKEQVQENSVQISNEGQQIQQDPPTVKESTNETQKAEKNDDNQAFRTLKGLVRIGPLGKNLLLSGDKEVSIVVICAEKPTKFLLQRVGECLPKQLQLSSSTDQFEVIMKLEEAGLSVTLANDPKVVVNVTLTSPLVREANLPEGIPAGKV